MSAFITDVCEHQSPVFDNRLCFPHWFFLESIHCSASQLPFHKGKPCLALHSLLSIRRLRCWPRPKLLVSNRLLVGLCLKDYFGLTRLCFSSCPEIRTSTEWMTNSQNIPYACTYANQHKWLKKLKMSVLNVVSKHFHQSNVVLKFFKPLPRTWPAYIISAPSRGLKDVNSNFIKHKAFLHSG